MGIPGPRSLGELVHAIDHSARAASEGLATVDFGGDAFADIRFDAYEWPYMITVGSRSADVAPAREGAIRISRLMEVRGWEYEDTSGSGECAFCMGREAAHDGKAEDRNPFTKTAEPRTDGWYESDYGLRLTGYHIGLTEAGRYPTRVVQRHDKLRGVVEL